MSDYTNTFGGAAKDSANSTILGAQHDTELDAIVTMSGTKADKVISATDNNIITMDSNGNLKDSGVSASSGSITATGDITVSGVLKSSKGADLDDTDIDGSNILTIGTDGNTFDFSGTQQVDAIATVGVGTEITLIHTSARQLTHDATNLILPDGENITTVSGDISKWIEYASGDFKLINYQKIKSKTTAGFSAYTSTSTAMTNLQFILNSTNFTGLAVDTDGSVANFDISNGRFTPVIAGWYLIGFNLSASNIAIGENVNCSIYKNGVLNIQLIGHDQQSGTAYAYVGSGAVYLNGSTDYIDFRISSTDTSWSVTGTADHERTRFYGFLQLPD